MIFTIICIFLALYSFLNFKKSFLIFLVLQVVWFPDAKLLNIPGVPSININFVMAFFYYLMFSIKGKKYKKQIRGTFPYKRPMIAIALSLIATCFTSVLGFPSEVAKAIGLIFINLVMIYIIWVMVEKKEDFSFIFKLIALVIFFACIYGLYSYTIQNNPILTYKFSLASRELNTYGETLRGYRFQSFFEHPISAAMNLGIYVIFVINELVYDNKNLPWKVFSIFTAILCIPCIILTKMRTGFFFLGIGLLSIINFKKIGFYKVLIVATCVLLIISPILGENINLFLSLFNKSAQKAVEGSTASMRFMQLEACYHLMMMSPLTGLGENFRSLVTNVHTVRALDFESLWFEQMTKHGIFGVLVYIYLIYYSIFKIPKIYRSKQILFLSLSYWLTYTLTSTPYFREYLYYIFVFYYIKKNNHVQKSV